MVVQGLPFFIVKDFNYIMGCHKKMGGRQYTNIIDSKEFKKFINDLGLIDL